jgi:SAM-dependent methyltransferase
MLITHHVIDDNRDAAIGDGADDPIGAFYTHHPYPPPVGDLERHRQAWQIPNRRRAEFHLLWPASAYRDDLDILVAGCGTFQAAKHAICWPQARVAAIDISATSLEHTHELKRKYNLTHLDTRQLPIERVHELEKTFDLIICTGVLHHLADPDAGLRALQSVLRPDGVMHLMVYAPYGRTGVYMLQEYCRRLGVGTSERDIRELAGALQSLPRHHPLAALLDQSKDFAQADALADTLLNPRDRAYSVPQLFELIEGAGLEFRRWFRQAPYLPACGVLRASPHKDRFAALSAKDQYAAVELWRGTMSRHSAIVGQHRVTTAGRQTIQFDDDRWQSYVPIRLPNTVCVQQRLPPGAAAVLLNQSHTYTDLILPIDALEKHLLDAIDGRRSIAGIVEQLSEPRDRAQQFDRARAFFERLWFWDQAVFDATGNTNHGQYGQ